MFSNIRRIPIGCCLTFSLLVGCEQTSTPKSCESTDTAAMTANGNVRLDKVSVAQSTDSILLVDWTPVENADGVTIANIVTVRLPIPPEFVPAANNIFEPARGRMSTEERWLQTKVMAKIGTVEIQSIGKSYHQIFPQERRTHFDTAFAVPARISNQELKIGKHTLQLNKQRLATVRSKLRCSYEILNSPTGQRERATVKVHTSCLISLEAVKVGSFISDLKPFGVYTTFGGYIDPSVSKNERKIMIKLAGIDDWIPIENELPLANDPSDKNEE